VRGEPGRVGNIDDERAERRRRLVGILEQHSGARVAVAIAIAIAGIAIAGISITIPGLAVAVAVAGLAVPIAVARFAVSIAARIPVTIARLAIAALVVAELIEIVEGRIQLRTREQQEPERNCEASHRMTINRPGSACPAALFESPSHPFQRSLYTGSGSARPLTG
jgi:hypothetical protein